MLELSSHFCAQLLLEKGLLSAEQVSDALRIHFEQPSLRLTDALLIFGFLSFTSIRSVLREVHPDRPVGQLLVDQGALDPATLEEALAVQEREGGELADILVEHAWASAAAVARALAIVKRRKAWSQRWQSLYERWSMAS